MSTAAQLLHGRGEPDWLVEMERLVDHAGDLSVSARAGLSATIESFLRESDAVDNRRAERLLGRLSLTGQTTLRTRLGLAPAGRLAA